MSLDVNFIHVGSCWFELFGMKLTLGLKRFSKYLKNPFNFLYGYLIFYLPLIMKQLEAKPPLIYFKRAPNSLWERGKKRIYSTPFFFVFFMIEIRTSLVRRE